MCALLNSGLLFAHKWYYLIQCAYFNTGKERNIVHIKQCTYPLPTLWNATHLSELPPPSTAVCSIEEDSITRPLRSEYSLISHGALDEV